MAVVVIRARGQRDGEADAVRGGWARRTGRHVVRGCALSAIEGNGACGRSARDARERERERESITTIHPSPDMARVEK